MRYLHSEIDAIERVEILRALRKGEFDVLVGINLLREGLDLPEVSLVAILDADKEGFLRSETSLIQTAGRAARHLNGEVILYADVMTDSIKKFLAVTEYRRKKQDRLQRGAQHHPAQRQPRRRGKPRRLRSEPQAGRCGAATKPGMDVDLTETIKELEEEMLTAANNLEFEKAALLRDQIKELKRAMDGSEPVKGAKQRPVSYGRSGKRSFVERLGQAQPTGFGAILTQCQGQAHPKSIRNPNPSTPFSPPRSGLPSVWYHHGTSLYP